MTISRWLPRSLYSRVLLVLLGGLVIAQVASLAVYWQDRGEFMQRAMGMRSVQVLSSVELANGLFVTLAGIRTALAINVGTAPLAFLIGGGGLGELIFTGIDLNEPGMMLAGAIPTALLAVAVDYLVGLISYWVVPRGVNPLR